MEKYDNQVNLQRSTEKMLNESLREIFTINIIYKRRRFKRQSQICKQYKRKIDNSRSHHNNQSNNGETEFLEQKDAHIICR